MIETVEFLEKVRCFDKGTKFELRPYTLLVGDQGCGKSTLLQMLWAAASGEKKGSKIEVKLVRPCRARYMDFEKQNPRVLSYFDKNIRGQVAAIFSSHGEFVREFLTTLEKFEQNVVVFMDEPDAGLSLRSVYEASRRFRAYVDRGEQIVAAVHNPILVEEAGEVLSLEHRRWMPAKEFLESQREEKADV